MSLLLFMSSKFFDIYKSSNDRFLNFFVKINMLFTWYRWQWILAFLLKLKCFRAFLDASLVIEVSSPHTNWERRWCKEVEEVEYLYSQWKEHEREKVGGERRGIFSSSPLVVQEKRKRRGISSSSLLHMHIEKGRGREEAIELCLSAHLIFCYFFLHCER